MSLKKSLSALVASSLALAAASCAGPQQSFVPDQASGDVSALSAKTVIPSNLKNGEAIPGEFIVKYKKGVARKNSAGSSVLKEIGGTSTGMQLVKMPVAKNGVDSMKAIKADSSIEWVEPNRIIKLDLPKVSVSGTVDSVFKGAALFNDPMLDKQYSHKITNAYEAWSSLKAKKVKVNEVVVAIVDTGVYAAHPDLKDRIVEGYSAYPGERWDDDQQGHGTHCAGIAAAIQDNNEGVAGVATNAKIQPVKVLNDQGSGTYAAVADGIAWAGSHGAKVLSMSLGGPSTSQAMEDAIKVALQNDVIVIAASGNSGPSAGLSYPAGIKGVMAVGATDSKDAIASFSQVGTHISVAAPGVGILSTFPLHSNGIGQQNYGSISGTSMACPYVSGLATLLRGVHPEFTAQQVRDRIEKTSDDKGAAGFDKVFGNGRVNVAKALAN